MSDRIVTLDVREDIRAGREPFTRVMQTAASLQAGEALLLVAPFEPVPLYRMLGREGFSNRARAIADGDWEVLFWRAAGSEIPIASTPLIEPGPLSCGGTGAQILEVDTRGLEPPQPMITILEALASLPPGAQLLARTERRPLHLDAQLEGRGFLGETTPQPDGSFVTRIRRRHA
jgi:uncharacterized protein (DUF2249 family)